MKNTVKLILLLTILSISSVCTEPRGVGHSGITTEGYRALTKGGKKMMGKKHSKAGDDDDDDDNDNNNNDYGDDYGDSNELPAPIPTQAPITTPDPTPDLTPDPDAPIAIQNSHNIRNEVKLNNMYNHLTHFQKHADANGGIRPIGSLGFNMTVDYIADQLRVAGYDVELQKHFVDAHTDLGPSIMESLVTAPEGAPIESFVQDVDFSPMTNSGAGEIVGTTELADNFGCDASDFSSFVAGNIAIIERGGCDFSVKVNHAKTASAIGAVVYNDALREDLFGGRLDNFETIPVFSASRVVGLELPGVVLHMFSNTLNLPDVPSTNIIADTPFGNPNQTIVVGAHIDSVFTGPGLNDNGAAGAMVLELALQLLLQPPTENKVRFAFWGAEENGLAGSEHYIRTAFSTGGLSEIALYLNFDVIASPNYARAIYPSLGGDTLQEMEEKIEATFLEYFDYVGLVVFRPLPLPLVEELRGLSDHFNFQSPFVQIPSGGLVTGSNQEKPPELVALFGGTAGEDFDPCYHLPCDDIDNVELEVLDQNAQAAAHTVWTFATMTDTDIDDQRRLKVVAMQHGVKELTFKAPSPGSRFYLGDAM